MRLLSESGSSRWQNDCVELFLLEEFHVGSTYVNWLNDPIVNRYLESRLTNHNLDGTRKFVRDCLDDPTVLLLGVRCKALNSQHVGNIKLGPINKYHGLGEIGILIGDQSAWNKGVATAAIQLMSGIAYKSQKLRKLTAGCYASNRGSQRAFQKAGFIVEGSRRYHLILDDKLDDLVLMAHWSDDYFNAEVKGRRV